MSQETVVLRVADLVPWERNAREHTDADVEAQVRSIREFGQVKPLVVWRDGKVLRVVAGNGTLEALRRAGIETALAVVRDDWTEPEAVAYGIADNRTAELAEWALEVASRHLDGLDEHLRAASAFTEADVEQMRRWEPPALTDEAFEPATLPTHTSFGATPEQAAIITQALDHAVGAGLAADQAEALVYVCRQYREGH